MKNVMLGCFFQTAEEIQWNVSTWTNYFLYTTNVNTFMCMCESVFVFFSASFTFLIIFLI